MYSIKQDIKSLRYRELRSSTLIMRIYHDPNVEAFRVTRASGPAEMGAARS